MKKKYVHISKRKLFLTPNYFESTDKIFGEDVKFNDVSIYWEVKGRYENGVLFLEVIDYTPTDYSNFYNQKLEKPIHKIQFEQLNWEKFQHFIWTWSSSTMHSIINDYKGEKESTGQETKVKGKNEFASNYVPDFIILPEQTPIERSVLETFEVLYKDAIFGNGFVSFSKSFSWYHKAISFRIENLYIKAEFDSIKFYFAKAINGMKRFTVKATIDLVDHKVKNCMATSDEISLINEGLIEVIKKKRFDKIFKVQNSQDKALVDIDELLNAVDDNAKNVFNQTTLDILNEVISWDGTRNAKQLQFLSGAMQSKTQKILFSLKPLFGFLFTIENDNSKHYCWELLDSHATYVWTIDSKFPISKMEETIALIQNIGREKYKQLYKSGEIDMEIKFTAIIHNAKSEVNGFQKWKSQFLEITDRTKAKEPSAKV